MEKLLLYLRAQLLYLENVRDIMKSDEFEWQKSALNVINEVERTFFTHFHILCDGPFLDGKTTALSKSPFYT